MSISASSYERPVQKRHVRNAHWRKYIANMIGIILKPRQACEISKNPKDTLAIYFLQDSSILRGCHVSWGVYRSLDYIKRAVWCSFAFCVIFGSFFTHVSPDTRRQGSERRWLYPSLGSDAFITPSKLVHYAGARHQGGQRSDNTGISGVPPCVQTQESIRLTNLVAKVL